MYERVTFECTFRIEFDKTNQIYTEITTEPYLREGYDYGQ